jgi:hypothetical protein
MLFWPSLTLSAAGPVYDRPIINKIRNAAEGGRLYRGGARIGPRAIINIDGSGFPILLRKRVLPISRAAPPFAQRDP